MSYDKKYRERAVQYRMEGHTIEETSKIYKIGTTTLKKWEKEYKATGDLSKKPLKRNPKKVCPSKLIEYLREHPDAYQSEIAEAFGCSQSAVSQAMKSHRITRKKRQHDTGSKIL
jgi:transposase